MNNPVDYIIGGRNYAVKPSVYRYILARNGVFVAAMSQTLDAVIPIAKCKVRGLEEWGTSIHLKHGRIPQRYWELALSVFLASPETERYAGIRWDGRGYQLYVPAQTGTGASLTYECGEDVVVELHSHPGFGPGPSSIDDADEQGLKIYGIVGDIYGGPAVYLRVGVYGYFHPVRWTEVFEGSMGDVIDTVALEANP